MGKEMGGRFKWEVLWLIYVEILQKTMRFCKAIILQKKKKKEFQNGFRKGRGNRDQISNVCWIIEKASEFWKNIYFCFIDYDKTFNCVNHNKL